MVVCPARLSFYRGGCLDKQLVCHFVVSVAPTPLSDSYRNGVAKMVVYKMPLAPLLSKSQGEKVREIDVLRTLSFCRVGFW